MKYVFLTLLGILALLCIFNPKIHIFNIIKGHFSTYRNDNTGKVSLVDYLSFLFLPIIISYYITFISDIVLSKVDVLLTVFSIFTALLFNFLMLIIQVKEKVSAEKEELVDKVNLDKYYKCVDQTYYNVSFAILLSIMAIILLWIISILPNKEITLVLQITSAVTETVMIMFFFDLIMILKRVFAIYDIKNQL
ncbi:MAG: hypothetical protein IJD90_04325 [Clostridia bacterium]|nr:hypothetical protein [Clostridia bacterium]